MTADLTQTERRVISAEWETQFIPWLRTAWEPGQHVALIGPTGEGKSTFAGGILNQRKWVLALDPKGEDETLSATGYKRLTRWPPSSKDRDRIAEGKPARFIIGGPVGSPSTRRCLSSTRKPIASRMHWPLRGKTFASP